MRGALETAWNIRKRFRKWLCRTCFRLQCTSIWCLRLSDSYLLPLPGVKGGGWHHCAPLGNPWAFLMRLRPSLESCLKGRDGKYVQVSPDLCKKLWHVSTLIQSLHSRDLILLEGFNSLSKLVGGSGWSSTLHRLWALSQRCGPLRHGVAPKAGKCLAEPIRKLSRFLSSRWFHLVSTFLSYTGPHH